MKTDSTKTKKKSTSPSRPRSYTPLSDALGNCGKLAESSLSDALAGWLENSKTVKKSMKSLMNS
jgi:hypothetical protein